MFERRWKEKISILLILAVLAGGLISVSTVSAKGKSVLFTKKNFPDPLLREEINDNFLGGYSLGDKISRSDLGLVDSLELSSGKRKINLKGISYLYDLDFLTLTPLEELIYTNHQIKKLVLLRQAKLEDVEVYANNLSTVDVSNKRVKSIRIESKKLGECKFSACNKLREMDLLAPKMTNLDLSSVAALDSLSLDQLKLSELDLSAAPKLGALYLNNMDLPGLNVSANPKLEILELNNTELTSLNLPDAKLKEVTVSHVSENMVRLLLSIRTKKLVLKNLDIEKLELADMKDLEKLEIIDCSRLQQLTIRGCGKLNSLTIQKAQNLQDVSVEGCGKIYTLSLSDCQRLKSLEPFRLLPLDSLDVVNTSVTDFQAKNFPNLKYLTFEANAQKKMDISSLRKLTDLKVSGERGTKKLDVSKMSKLETLVWRNGVLKSVKFGRLNKFWHIDLYGNRLSGAWDLSSCKELRYFRCSNNKITSLKFGKQPDNLEEVYCSNNKLKILNASYAYNLRDLDCSGNKGIKVYMFSAEENCGEWIFGKNAKVYYGIRK